MVFIDNIQQKRSFLIIRCSVARNARFLCKLLNPGTLQSLEQVTDFLVTWLLLNLVNYLSMYLHFL